MLCIRDYNSTGATSVVCACVRLVLPERLSCSLQHANAQDLIRGLVRAEGAVNAADSKQKV